MISESFAIDWVLTDLGHTYRTELSNGVFVQHVDPKSGAAGLTLTLTKQQLVGVVSGTGLEGIAADGDTGLLERLVSFLDEQTPEFAIVTP